MFSVISCLFWQSFDDKDTIEDHDGVLWAAVDEPNVIGRGDVVSSLFPIQGKPTHGGLCDLRYRVVNHNNVAHAAEVNHVCPYTKTVERHNMVSSTLRNNVNSGGGCMGNQGALPGKAALMAVLFGLCPEFFHKLSFSGFGAPEQPPLQIFIRNGQWRYGCVERGRPFHQVQ
jgi:hypothetical protein